MIGSETFQYRNVCGGFSVLLHSTGESAISCKPPSLQADTDTINDKDAVWSSFHSFFNCKCCPSAFSIFSAKVLTSYINIHTTTASKSYQILLDVGVICADMHLI